MNRAVAHDPVGDRRSTLPRVRPIRSRLRRRITLLGACFAAVMSVARPVHALDPAKRLTQYLHTSWRIEDGTAPAGMISIAQSADDFLWFSAFSQELYRFDGVRFVPRTVSVDGKTVNPIVQVHADRTGGLWVLGLHQIVHLKGGVVVSQFELPGLMALHHPVDDPDGSVWIVRGFANVTGKPLCRVSDQGVRCFGAPDGIPMAEAFSLLADGAGGFWIGGQRALVHWRQGTSQVYPIKSLENNTGDIGVDALAHGPDGTMWVGIQAGPGLGLGRLIDGVVEPFVTSGFDGRRLVVLALAADRDGNLWVGTLGKGLFRIRGDVVEHYGRTDGLSNDTVDDVFEDRDGMLWVITPSGIDCFRNPRITTFSALEGLGPAAAGVLASKDGAIWVANNGSLDRIANGRVSSIRQGNGLPGVQVTSLLEDSAGNMWVGVDDRLYLFKDGRFRHLPGPGGEPLGMVSGMTEDIDGNIWAECAGRTRQLIRIRGSQVRERFPAPRTPFGHALAPDPHGGIWISTSENWDLLHFRDGGFTRFPLNLSSVPVFHIASARDGSVLVPTVDGLVAVRNGQVKRMTTKNGLPCNPVISLMQDKGKRWWLFTDCGVVHLADSELQRWWNDPGTIVQIRVFDVLDGARPQGRPSFNAAALSPDGRVWFATGGVVQLVDPAILSERARPPETYIDSVVVDGKPLAATGDLRLSPHPRQLQIDYTSPTFATPQKVTFRYRLDDFDRDWNDAGTRRQAIYTDLPPGRYAFRVIASNGDGVWHDSAAMLAFSVAPAYQQTIWFRALAGALLAALLWAAYSTRVRVVEGHAAEISAFSERLMQAQEQERTRIAGELHDSVMQQISALSLVLGTAKRKIPPELEAKAMVADVQRKLIDVGNEVRHLSHEMHPPELKLTGLPEVLQGYCDSFSQAHGIPVSCEVEASVADLSEGSGLALYRITQEALGNAAKHAAPTRIELRLTRTGRDVVLTIADDGRGRDPGQADRGGLGLANMRERARQLNGTFELDSQPGRGTTVRVAVPFHAREASRTKA